jgi:hypothetical protein
MMGNDRETWLHSMLERKMIDDVTFKKIHQMLVSGDKQLADLAVDLMIEIYYKRKTFRT